MKTIIMNSLLGMLLVALILMVGITLPQMVRNIMAVIAVIFVFVYAFYGKKIKL